MKVRAALLALTAVASLGCPPKYVAAPQEARVNNDIDWRIESPPSPPIVPASAPAPSEPEREP